MKSTKSIKALASVDQHPYSTIMPHPSRLRTVSRTLLDAMTMTTATRAHDEGDTAKARLKSLLFVNFLRRSWRKPRPLQNAPISRKIAPAP